MSQAEALLNDLTNDEAIAFTTNPETEAHIVIGLDRVITVPESLKRIAVQHDHNMETVTFDCPRYWDGIDMSVMNVLINYVRADGKLGSYKAENVTVDESDNTIMHFTWTITRNVSDAKGNIAFLVCARKTDSEGNEENHWSTELNKVLYVSEGLDCHETIVEMYPDVITQILEQLESSISVSGKSAYEYAKDGGYTGTEEEFATKLAEENPTLEEFNSLSEEIADIITELDMVENPDAISLEPCAVSEPVVASGGESLLSVSDFTTGYYSLFDNGYINANDSNTGYKKAKLENLPAGDYETISLRAIFCVIEDLVTGEKRKLMQTDDIFNGTITLQNASNVYLTINSNVDTFYFRLQGGNSGSTPDEPDTPDMPDTPDNGKTRYSRRLLNIETHLSDIDIQLEKNEITSVIRVEKDGSGDYSTIKEAIEYASTHPNTKIYIGAGTYDLIEEFGDNYFATLGTVGKSGLKLSNNMHLIFSSNSKVVCHYNGDNANVKTYFSPFNLLDKATGFTLENMNLECSNVRYAIHDEANSHLTPYRNYYKNCKIKIDNSQNNVWNPRQCIGGGLGVGEIVIENCYFESIPKTENESADIVTYHNGNGNGVQSNIVITGCYFAGKDTCRCSHYGSQTEKSQMIVSNCSMGKEPRVIFESSAFDVENFELITWNNDVRQS